MILLTGSGLLVRSFVRLEAVDLGFPTERRHTAAVSLSESKYADGASRARFFQALVKDVEAIPGVISASFTNKVPIRHRWTNWYIWNADTPPAGREDGLSTYSRTAMPGYFATLGIPVLRGGDHSFDDASRGEPCLVVNQSAAEALFAGTALLLTLTGLYAVLAFYAGRRTREIGIRMALGATGVHVSRMVVVRGLTLVGVGIAAGLMAAGGLARFLQAQLYQVGPLDPLTFASVAVGFPVVGLGATLLPVRRATRVDPVDAIST